MSKPPIPQEDVDILNALKQQYYCALTINSVLLVILLTTSYKIVTLGKLYHLLVILVCMVIASVASIGQNYFNYQLFDIYFKIYEEWPNLDKALITRQHKYGTAMVSCATINFAFLAIAFWRFSATYLVSSKRFTNILISKNINHGITKLFVIDGIIMILNILFPVLWGTLTIEIGDIDQHHAARQVARLSILMIIILMFVSCAAISYAFFVIRQFMVLSGTGTMNIRIILIHAISFTSWVFSLLLSVLASSRSLRNKGSSKFSIKGTTAINIFQQIIGFLAQVILDYIFLTIYSQAKEREQQELEQQQDYYESSVTDFEDVAHLSSSVNTSLSDTQPFDAKMTLSNNKRMLPVLDQHIERLIIRRSTNLSKQIE